MLKTLYATQGGGTAIFDDLQQWYTFIEVPKFGEYKEGDSVPEEWGVQRIGYVSIGPVEEMETAERDGYETGLANKNDPNKFIPESWYHTEWKAGHERGCKERLAMDAL